MTQPSLFDVTANYHGGNAQSVAANERVQPSKANDCEAIIKLLRVWRVTGLTCDQIEDLLGMRHQTASARLTELKALGAVEVRGRRETRTGSTAGINFAVQL